MSKLQVNQRSIVLVMSFHAVFTVLLLIAVAHIQIRTTQQIAQQESEIANLRGILKKHVGTESQGNKQKSEMATKQDEGFQYEQKESKQSEAEEGKIREEEGEDVGVNANPLVLRIKRKAKSKCCEKGSRGRRGPKGDRGRRGRRGEKGDTGDDGRDGKKGQKGRRGAKGNKGEKGESDKRLIFAESAHYVGRGKKIRPTKIVKTGSGQAYLLSSWTANHNTRNMLYKHGYLEVLVSGYYYIYGQIDYRDGQPAMTGFKLYINDRPVIEAANSVISKTRMYNTNYIGGVFRISSGEKISVRTDYAQDFFFTKTKSFFGAFLIHQ